VLSAVVLPEPPFSPSLVLPPLRLALSAFSLSAFSLSAFSLSALSFSAFALASSPFFPASTVTRLVRIVPSMVLATVATSLSLLPSRSAPSARMKPLCRRLAANMPTASPCSAPRLTALSEGATTSMRMPSSPRPVSSTLWPAASTTAPSGARTSAFAPTATLEAINTTSPT
jgi:hypothetical protein